MSATFDLVTIDGDTAALAAFWSAALELHESEREDGDRWVVLSSADGTRRLGLQRGAHVAGGVHLDLACEVESFDSEIARLRGLGATLLRPCRYEPYGAIANLADPEGNLFDLCAYART